MNSFEWFDEDIRARLVEAEAASYAYVTGLIVRSAWERYRFAEEAIGICETEKLLGLQWNAAHDRGRFDHRTVQGAHDVLMEEFARRVCAEPNLFHLAMTVTDWSIRWEDFAESQVASWMQDGFIVRAVVEATQFANAPRGLAAERALNTFLRLMYGLIEGEEHFSMRVL